MLSKRRAVASPARSFIEAKLWDRCYKDLMAQAGSRLKQEVVRLGGHFAHVLDESIDSRHDEATGEAWLYGRFSYMLYRWPSD